jgi:Domain of unknown function (DUF4396)
MTAIDGALVLWYALTIPAAMFAVYDLATRTPAMKVMRWGWILVVLYTGPIGLFVYLISCREPLPGMHPAYIAPLWKQAVGSTIHCVAGDATGIIAGAMLGALLHVGIGADLVLEYLLGFAFGLFIFQALFTRLMVGGGYWTAVRRTILPEWLSMNALMGGMIPVMRLLTVRDPKAMEPGGAHFWGVMSMAILVGSLTAYPVNVWLVYRGLKHGMGTEGVLGRGGHRMDAERSLPPRTSRHPNKETSGVALASLLILAAGLWVGFAPAEAHATTHRPTGERFVSGAGGSETNARRTP